MTRSKLGHLPSSVLASVLATAVGLAPIQGALASAPEEVQPEGEEGEEGAEGEEVGEGEEGDVSPEGEEGENPEGEEAEDEGELPVAEEVEEVEAPPTELEDPGPMRPAEPTWGPKDHPRNGKGMLITGGIVTGLGAAFIVSSVLLTRCDFDSALSCKFGDQRDFLVPTAVATTGLGLLLIGVGVSNRIKYKKWQNWTPEQTAVVPSYVPGGGGVAFVGRF